MANLVNDIRLAVDSGKTAVGVRDVTRAIVSDSAKLIVVSSKLDQSSLDDIKHLAGISGIPVIVYDADSMALGTVCGKPFSVAAVAVVDPGNSNILEEKY